MRILVFSCARSRQVPRLLGLQPYPRISRLGSREDCKRTPSAWRLGVRGQDARRHQARAAHAAHAAHAARPLPPTEPRETREHPQALPEHFSNNQTMKVKVFVYIT